MALENGFMEMQSAEDLKTVYPVIKLPLSALLNIRSVQPASVYYVICLYLKAVWIVWNIA